MKDKNLKVVKEHHLFYLESLITVARRIAYHEELSTKEQTMRLQALLSHAEQEISHMLTGHFGEVAS